MDKDKLRANRQKALIQDTLRAAFKGTTSEAPVLHPFVLAVQSLRREIEFMEPFTDPKMAELFAQAEPAYKSGVQVLADAESMIFGDAEVSPDADQQLPLVEYHLNILKIHRLLFTRQVEGYSLIPPAPPSLQRQVVRTYEALGQLTSVLTSMSKVPKPPRTKKADAFKTRKVISRNLPHDKETPLDLPNRVSPFITDGSKKSTVQIDGVIWPRYV
ncbi:hypothetical protein TRFO_35165 [Tritrichomonas foetus]|uniref:Uncharacterized protein n=1 Tax=Tritrichomonas foetus TaxID=1144522 RepID=A0A1J4JGZ1_9EUKA|nr:hypothetical protein TRFO_35165 [Tritrichomonas foetus]|eukprot:OHS98426.1 hypothetical protein TRFO_35165 [Tritrichomonas foetus]